MSSGLVPGRKRGLVQRLSPYDAPWRWVSPSRQKIQRQWPGAVGRHSSARLFAARPMAPSAALQPDPSWRTSLSIVHTTSPRETSSPYLTVDALPFPSSSWPQILQTCPRLPVPGTTSGPAAMALRSQPECPSNTTRPGPLLKTLNAAVRVAYGFGRPLLPISLPLRRLPASSQP